jgi:outer membrane protein OmpA-like peptidoglycan-associated protein
MRHLVFTTLAVTVIVACGGGQPAASPAPDTEQVATPAAPDGTDTTPAETATEAHGPAAEGDAADTPNEASTKDGGFVLRKSDTAKDAHGAVPSQIKPTATHAALKLVVVDKEKGPIEGIVISLTAPDGTKFYTKETDSAGYAEVLVPVGQEYSLVYLSLGRKDVATSVAVDGRPRQNIKLTLRYKGYTPPEVEQRFVLQGVNFDTAKATIRPESLPRLESVVEYMTHKTGSRIQVSGHTDNAGNPAANKTLSLKRAQACRDYLISKGIDGSRIEAVGHGQEQPVATNDTVEGRQRNRRIEATEL